MFHSSTQKKHWLFRDSEELDRLRKTTNQNYCEKHSKAAAEKSSEFLSPAEEYLLSQYFLKKLLEFCNHFQPPIPRSALATATAYFKRFYLYTSVMEYHPKDIFLCCSYLAFKVEEYNVSVDQFVHVLAPQLREPAAEFVLSHELLLLKKLKFHLTVHSPFRPLEGFIIDIKTRSPGIVNPDQFRKAADSFLVKSLSSDVGQLYPPSQIALAALRYSSKQTMVQIDGYILSVLLRSETPDISHKAMDTLQRIEDMAPLFGRERCGNEVSQRASDKSIHPSLNPQISPIERKLERLRLKDPSPKSRKRKSEEAAAGAAVEKKSKLSEEEEVIPGISKLH